MSPSQSDSLSLSALSESFVSKVDGGLIDVPLTWPSRRLSIELESPSFELKNHHVRLMASSWANWGAAGVLGIFASAAAWDRARMPRAPAQRCPPPRCHSGRLAGLLPSHHSLDGHRGDSRA